jgi:cell wall-associated NlpC family hydrolase
LAPGDLVFFNTMKQTFSHVGIYVGEGRCVHAPRTGERIRREKLAGSYWRDRFDGARRVVASAEAVPKISRP